jgi:hypothetical protein
LRIDPRSDFLQRRVPVVARVAEMTEFTGQYAVPSYPTMDEDLGRAMANGEIAGYSPRTDMATVLRNIGMITDGGPNNGAAYLINVPLTIDAAVMIHPAIGR